MDTYDVEKRIKAELEKVRKMPGVTIKGRVITVPSLVAGCNPVQFLSRHGFVVQWA